MLGGSGEADSDAVVYEAALREKLEREQAAMERAAKDREMWGSSPALLREDARRQEERAEGELRSEAARAPSSVTSHSASSSGSPDPLEVAESGEQVACAGVGLPPAGGSRPSEFAPGGGQGSGSGAGNFWPNSCLSSLHMFIMSFYRLP